MAIIHVDGKTLAVDGSSRAPSLAHISAFRNKSFSRLGYKASTVPSTVATLGYLNERYGRLDWSTIVKPSIRIAKRGYRVTKLQHELQEKILKTFLKLNQNLVQNIF